MADKIKIAITIPDDLDFQTLNLTRDPVTHDVAFDWRPIDAICAASGIDVSVLRDQHEDNVAGLITAWYFEHRARGGSPDPVQEQIIAETLAEDAFGINAAPGGSGVLQ